MLTRRKLLISGLILGAALPLSGWSQSPASPPAPSPMDALAWMAGGKWTAEEKDGDRLLRVEMNCRRSENRQAILFEVSYLTAEGRVVPQYQGMYVWHPVKKAFLLWQVNRDGNIAEGEMREEDGKWTQHSLVTESGGGTHELRTVMQRTGEDMLHLKGYFRAKETDSWTDAVDLIFRRAAR